MNTTTADEDRTELVPVDFELRRVTPQEFNALTETEAFREYAAVAWGPTFGVVALSMRWERVPAGTALSEIYELRVACFDAAQKLAEHELREIESASLESQSSTVH